MIAANAIDGIRFTRQKGYAICHIDDFSDDLKEILRTQLASVCYGPSKAASTRKAYCYKNTLSEFIERYDAKKHTTRMGMIGELLTHILVMQFFEEFRAVSPYFNLEEKSIKKGFDVVLYSRGKNEVWITEVKSGELHKNKNANETVIDLLGTAKRDLKKRLNENKITFWENAINGATIALENKKDMKEAVVEILGCIEDDIVDKKAKSIDKNVILVSSLFSCLSDEVTEAEVKAATLNIAKEKIFKDLIVFSFQKGTYKRIEDFLKSEAM